MRSNLYEQISESDNPVIGAFLGVAFDRSTLTQQDIPANQASQELLINNCNSDTNWAWRVSERVKA